MFYSRFGNFSHRKFLSALLLTFFLAACSVSDPVPDSILGAQTGTSAGVETGDETSAGTTTTTTAGFTFTPKKTFSVSWKAPLSREDGSNLALVEIAEYRVYYGVKTGVYKNTIVVDGNSTLEVKDASIPKGTYYVVLTAVDSDGRESSYSQEGVVVV